MRLSFTKMQGLGNDFVVINATQTAFEFSRSQLRHLADRHFGVGCDQILCVEPARSADTDFYYRIFNADGGEVEQCGNGARCFVRFVHDQGLSQKKSIRVGTLSGVIELALEQNGQVTVNMGVPEFEPANIPLVAPQRALTYDFVMGDTCLTVSCLSMGNPHVVQRVKDVRTASVATQGPWLESHPRFPKRVNVGFMQVKSRHHIELRVYERGAGETLACGTGACAAVVAGIQRQWLDLGSPVRVSTRGGELVISWAGEGASVKMTGPAQKVYEGYIELS